MKTVTTTAILSILRIHAVTVAVVFAHAVANLVAVADETTDTVA